MKEFERFEFDPSACSCELDEFCDLLRCREHLKENEHIVPFFESHKHLSAFLGSHIPYVASFDRLAYQYSLFGDFTCDLVVGDSTQGCYCFVEFEDASPTSIFRSVPNRATPEWSPRFERGFSQIVDWFWKLDDMKNTLDYRNRFEKDDILYYGMLIIGRSNSMNAKQENRLRWRLSRVLVDSRQIFCLTFDQLCDTLRSKLVYFNAESEE